MKRKEFIKELQRAGCYLARLGAKHDIYVNSHTGLKQPVPRHAELSDILAKHIKRHLGIE